MRGVYHSDQHLQSQGGERKREGGEGRTPLSLPNVFALYSRLDAFLSAMLGEDRDQGTCLMRR